MKDKKIIIILAGIAVILALFFLTRPKTVTDQNGNGGAIETTEQNTVFDSIKDAMSKSLSLKCDYSSGNTTVTAYIKGNSVRVDSKDVDGNTSGAILKDDKLWTWSEEKGEGVIMPLTSDDNESSSEQIINDLENERQYCNTAVVADSMFNPPGNITFQDLSQMLEQLTGFVPAE